MSLNQSSITIAAELDRQIHFSLQQNDVPVIKSLRIENHTDTTFRDLLLKISAEPEFASTCETTIAELAPNSVYHVKNADLKLSPEYLARLTERVHGLIHTEVTEVGRRVAELGTTVDLLPKDEWGGLTTLPEILAAFVLPNNPSIGRLLRAAADIIGEWTGDPTLDGYQSRDPKRVLMIVAAVYTALQKANLSYISPPASFGHNGQRVRLPQQILDARMATCLDLALLAAACLEQIGLNSVVVLVQGHAFSGVWLRDECFSEPASDLRLPVLKRVELDELAVFDPTCVTSRPALGFERAIEEAKRRLVDDDDFLCCIDISRARKGQIRPMPESLAKERTQEEQSDPQSGDEMSTQAPRIPVIETSDPEDKQETTAETPQTRLDRWCRKLLDLSLRNRLLNYRDTKKTLPLLCPDLAKLEDMLAGGKEFKILARPDDLSGRDPRDTRSYQQRTGRDGQEEILREELTARRLRSDTTKEELERRLVEIYRAARLGIEEGGASALYLALGFLSWYESKSSEKEREAPILLLPVTLKRKSVREGFSLLLSDDDPRVNVTLLEMLQQDHGITIPGLDPLPEDESGLDVPKILRAFRHAVRDIDRWSVKNTARIGLFSFTKFLMWRDLSERSDELMKSSVVAHLIETPDQPYDDGDGFPQPERLDADHPPSETFCPMPADSSQLAAVFAAAKGKSFVIEGPPGTGKSQTITNLIAHCLTEGKTVLFVSEKMAALNVVHQRLSRIGLGRFCLELHSNKANKLRVISQIDEALRSSDSFDEEQWLSRALQLKDLRDDLNSYVDAIHRRRSTGDTVFRATSRLIGLKDVPQVELSWANPESLDAKALAELRELVDRVATVGLNCGDVVDHVWSGVKKTDWTPGWESNLRRLVDEFESATQRMQELTRSCSETLGLGESGWSFEDLEVMCELTVELMDSPAPPVSIVVRPDWDEIQAMVGDWVVCGRRRDELRQEIFGAFREKILDLDLEGLLEQAAVASASRWPLSWWRYRPIRAALALVAKDGKKPAFDEIEPTLTKGIELQAEQKKLDAASDQARELLGRFWNGGEAEWDGVSRVGEWSGRVRALALRAAGSDFERAAKYREHWARLASEARELLHRNGQLGEAFTAFRAAFKKFEDCRRRLDEELHLNAEAIWGDDKSVDLIGRTSARVSRWQSAWNTLRDWCIWRSARDQACAADLYALIDALETGAVECEQLAQVFERSYSQWWLTAVMAQEPVLSQFCSPDHERKIRKFRDVDEEFLRLTQKLVQTRLAGRIPSSSSTVMRNSEMGIIKREIGKRRRHLPVRKLLHQIPNLLPRLKPCLLMSPMSVAQYLDAEFQPFDLVVFDEASQIPVWDAVGALARGKQAVVVGDPKQLPPTSFFQRADDDEDQHDDVVEDLESILDDCIGAQIPLLSLDWHYRSRHESLITFSNYHYYGNRLLTFPSADNETLGVSWHHVPDGVYDKGKTRTNKAEARAVVDEILRRLQDPEFSEFSIGVVTFSQAQQTLIEDLLDAARTAQPDLDAYFAEDRDEGIFVKNLENVQGDERDVILFSICYGPDATGKVSMNFGPMNRDGGERRLNVAITRARREVKVFSTLKADHIDLARTRAQGVADLKSFLEYAERGPAAIAQATELDLEADFDSPFEEEVYNALVQRGWKLHKQVGCARFRIDLAVVDPDAPGRYLVGIECDGANYHRAKSARDRDKLREGVLRDLGWKLLRIWSSDWWADPEREIIKLVEGIERAIEQRVLEPGPSGIDSTDAVSGGDSQPVDRAASVFAGPPPAAEPQLSEASPAESYEVYAPIDFSGYRGEQADFYEYSAAQDIRERLVEVVNAEGPISLELATRRVAAIWGFSRVRERAAERVRRCIPQDRVRTTEAGGKAYLWPIDIDPNTYREFRVPDFDEESKRQAVDLPPEEIANAMLHLLEEQISAPVEDLVRGTAKLFGFGRTGRVVQERMRLGLEVLTTRRDAHENGGSVSLKRSYD